MSGTYCLGVNMIVVGNDDNTVVLRIGDNQGVSMTSTMSPTRAKELAEQLILAADQIQKRPLPDPSV